MSDFWDRYGPKKKEEEEEKDREKNNLSFWEKYGPSRQEEPEDEMEETPGADNGSGLLGKLADRGITIQLPEPEEVDIRPNGAKNAETDALAALGEETRKNQTVRNQEWLDSLRSPEEIQAELDEETAKVKEYDRQAFKNNALGVWRDLIGQNAKTDAENQRISAERKAHDERKAALEDELAEARWAGYERLRNNSDFESKSRYKSTATGKEVKAGLFGNNGRGVFEDPLYEYINGNDEAIFYLQQAKNAGAVQNPAYKTAVTQNAAEYKQYRNLSEDERELYNYIHATDGQERANEYLAYLMSDLNVRQAEKEKAAAEEFAGKNALNATLASAGTVLASPLRGAAYLGQAVDMLATGKIDENAPINRISYLPGAVRAKVSEDIEQNWGFWGAFGYQTGMSMLDFLFNSAVSGGSEALSLALMGTGAAADATIAAKERGLGDTQSFVLGTIAGAAEIASEKISFESLFNKAKLTKEPVKYILQNFAFEGLEEGESDVVNWLADAIVAQDKSEWMEDIRAYQKDNPGASEDEAFWAAVQKRLKEGGLDMLGGAISGGIMGTSGVVGSRIANVAQRSADRSANIDTARRARQEVENLREARGPKIELRQNQDTDGQIVLPTGAESAEAEMGAESGEGETFRFGAEPETRTLTPTVEEAETNEAVDRAMEEGNVIRATGIRYGADEELISRAERYSQITGQELEFYSHEAENGVAENGFVTPDGKIHINVKGKNPMEMTFGHETTHTWEGTDAYRDLVDLAKKSTMESGEDWAEKAARTARLYEAHGDTVTKEMIDQELTADWVGENLFNNEKTVREIYRDKPSLARRMRNALDNFIVRAAEAGGVLTPYEERKFRNTLKVFDKYARMMTEEDREQAPQEARGGAQAGETAQMGNRQGEAQIPQETTREAQLRARPWRAGYQTESEKAAAGYGPIERGNGQPVPEDSMAETEGIPAGNGQAAQENAQQAETVSGMIVPESGEESPAEYRARMDALYDAGEITGEEYDEAMALADEAESTGRGFSSSTVERDEGLRGKLAEIADRLRGRYSLSEEERQNRDDPEIRRSLSEAGAYDYSKSFAEQIDDYKAGNFPPDDTLIVRGTPRAFQRIGMLPLPMTYGQGHLKDALANKNGNHLGEALLKQLPAALENPIAIIDSATHPGRLVAIIDIPTQNGNTIAAVEVEGSGQTHGNEIDSNAIVTVHTRANTYTKLLRDAIQSEINNQGGIYYWDKNKATQQLSNPGVQFPSAYSQIPDGLIRSIHDPLSRVNPKIKSVTKTKQFGDFFGRWWKNRSRASKVVDENGEPLIVYHQTGADIEEFDNSNPVAGANDSETPNGYFFKENNHDIGLEGKKQMAFFLNMRKPLHFQNRAEANAWYCENVEGYKELQDEMKSVVGEIEARMDDIESQMFTMPDEEYDRLQAEWDRIKEEELTPVENRYRGQLRELLNDYFLSGNSRYDGIILDDDGHRYVDGKREDVKTYIVFNKNQMKSATDNIGLFDRKNNKVKYSLSPEEIDRMDEEYYDAAMRGDRDAEDRIMRRRAIEGGYDIEGYHGTEADFDEFKYGDIGYHIGTEAQARARIKDKRFFERREGSPQRDARIMHLRANLQNPLEVDYDFGDWHGPTVVRELLDNEIFKDDEIYNGHTGAEINQALEDALRNMNANWWENDPEDDRAVRELLMRFGYDGIAYPNEAEGVTPEMRATGDYPTSYIVFNPEQLKYADTETYDYAGNLILPSERYDSRSPNMRWSLSEEQGPIANLPTSQARDEAIRIEGRLAASMARIFGMNTNHTSGEFRQFRAEVVRPIIDAMIEGREDIDPDAIFSEHWNGDLLAGQQARDEFDDAMTQAWRSVQQLNTFAERQRQETAVREQRNAAIDARIPQDTEGIIRLGENLKHARRERQRVLGRLLLTPDDMELVRESAAGQISDAELAARRPFNYQDILDAAAVERAFREQDEAWSRYTRRLSERRIETADRLLEDADKWKDKGNGFAYARETAERNFRDVMGSDAAAMIDEYIRPVHRSEAESTRFKNEYIKRVKDLKLDQKARRGNAVSEAAAVQWLGEAEDNVRYLQTMRNPDAVRDGQNLSEWLSAIEQFRAENPNLDYNKVYLGIREFSRIYDELITEMNRVLVENGYLPVNVRRGYFPHFNGGDDGILAKFASLLGINLDTNALPTAINGLTSGFKPGKAWFGHAQERTGFRTDYDAVQGFDGYIGGVSDVIHQTANIRNLRTLASRIRYQFSDEGIKNRIDEIMADESRTVEEREAAIRDLTENGRFKNARLVNWLDEFTNLLANKKSKYDRGIEDLMGRRVYTWMKNIEGRVAANMIAGNLGSALTNFIPLNQAGAMLGDFSMLRGAFDTMVGRGRKDDFVQQSDFLTNRRGTDPLIQNRADRISEFLSSPMNLIDNFTSEAIVRAAYGKYIRQGMDAESAMQAADEFAAGVMADRSKGAQPTVFGSRNPLMKLFTQFQVEVNNEFSTIFKDIPKGVHIPDREKKNMAAVAAWTLLRYFVGAYLFNDLYEKIVGRRVALDPIDILNDAVGDLSGKKLNNVFDMISNGVIDDVRRQNPSDVTQELVTNVAEELPFVGGLLGGGRIPISSAFPDFENINKAAFSENWSGAKKAQVIGRELGGSVGTYILPPFAGGAIRKGVQTAENALAGGRYVKDKEGNDQLQYPFYMDTPLDAAGTIAKSALFGPTATEEGRGWVEGGFGSQSAKNTELYKRLTQDLGEDQRTSFAFISGLTGLDPLGKRVAVAESGLSEEGKAEAMSAVVSESERYKFRAAYEAGVSADAWAGFYRTLPRYDEDGNGSYKQAEVTAALDNARIPLSAGEGAAQGLFGGDTETRSLTRAEKAAIWSAYNPKWKTANNPFDASIGDRVVSRIGQMQDEEGE